MWIPGKSGNEKGRPPSSGSRQRLFDETIGPKKEALLQKALAMALEGNEQILKTLLDRILPAKPKDEGIQLNLASLSLDTADSLLKLNALVIEATANGKLTPDEGLKLTTLIKIRHESLALTEIHSEIQSLKQQFNKVKNGENYHEQNKAG